VSENKFFIICYLQSIKSHFLFIPAKNNWNREQTDALIEEYKLNSTELEHPDSNKVPVWEKIAKNLSEQLGTVVTHENCIGKWRSLKNSYKKVEFSGRTEVSKQKWGHYKVLHELLKDVVKEPEMKPRINYGVPTIFNDTPALLKTGTSTISGQPTIKIVEPTAVLSTVNPTATQQDLHFPMWFKQFFQVYQKNEETKIALLAKMKSNLTLMADRQCKALDKLNEHLSKLNNNT